MTSAGTHLGLPENGVPPTTTVIAGLQNCEGWLNPPDWQDICKIYNHPEADRIWIEYGMFKEIPFLFKTIFYHILSTSG